MSNQQQTNPVVDIIRGLASLAILAVVGAYFGLYTVPKPIMNIWDRFNGNGADQFLSINAKMPNNEKLFIASVSSAIDAYNQAANEMARGAVRSERAKNVCAAVSGSTGGEWTGIVHDLSTNGDGYGVLSVKIAPHIVVRTWNNSFSDIGADTLIKPGTDVHSAAVKLKVGDEVSFSGDFIFSDLDCASEMSPTLAGSMTEPEYVMRFGSIKPL